MYKPLRRLTKLRHLMVAGAFNWIARDWHDPLFLGIDNLSVLTGLTKLGIMDECFAWALTDKLSELLSCLSGLEELAVRSSHKDPYNFDSDKNEDQDEWHIGLMPVIGQLQQIKKLVWRCGSMWLPQHGRQYAPQLPKAPALHGLSHLVGLSKLTELVGFGSAGREALDTFWATVKGQHNSCVEHGACSD